MLHSSILPMVESSVSGQLTTSKVGIVRLNLDVQAVVEVISKMEEEHVFEMGSAGAQEEDGCQNVDNDLENDKSPDRPFLGSRICFGDTKEKGTKRQSSEHGTEVTPDQRDEAVLESEISLIGF
jgi:hypothetical protein